MATFEQPDLDKNFTKGRFADRVFIVTGGASGIGLATVERLCNDGGIVAILDCSEERGKEAAGRLESKGYSARFYSGDVTNRANCEEAVERVAADNGNIIHGLVNCAARILPHVKGGKGEDVTDDMWECVLSSGLKGTSYTVQSCLPYMKNVSEGCAIVNISSIVGTRPFPNSWAYCSSKAAVESLTRCMALDLNQYGIRVNAVAPGVTWSPLIQSFFDTRQASEEAFGSAHLMKRLGEASEIAATIAFLLSRDASFITGTTVFVDGGSNAKSPSVK